MLFVLAENESATVSDERTPPSFHSALKEFRTETERDFPGDAENDAENSVLSSRNFAPAENSARIFSEESCAESENESYRSGIADFVVGFPEMSMFAAVKSPLSPSCPRSHSAAARIFPTPSFSALFVAATFSAPMAQSPSLMYDGAPFHPPASSSICGASESCDVVLTTEEPCPMSGAAFGDVPAVGIEKNEASRRTFPNAVLPSSFIHAHGGPNGDSWRAKRATALRTGDMSAHSAIAAAMNFPSNCAPAFLSVAEPFSTKKRDAVSDAVSDAFFRSFAPAENDAAASISSSSMNSAFISLEGDVAESVAESGFCAEVSVGSAVPVPHLSESDFASGFAIAEGVGFLIFERESENVFVPAFAPIFAPAASASMPSPNRGFLTLSASMSAPLPGSAVFGTERKRRASAPFHRARIPASASALCAGVRAFPSGRKYAHDDLNSMLREFSG